MGLLFPDKPPSKSEVVAVRLTPLERQRLEFWAAMNRKSPSGAAGELLADAVRAALHASTAPPPPAKGMVAPVYTVPAAPAVAATDTETEEKDDSNE